MNTQPLRARSTEIVAALEQDIEAGVLLPGDTLDERLLASRFGVSRTPVREAVQQLSTRGVLRVLPRQGIVVARMSIAELRSMFELLAELEGACAKLAARRMDETLCKKMSAALEACKVAADVGDHVAYNDANTQFHEALYEASRNKFLAEELRTIRKRTQGYRSSPFQQAGRMRESVKDHQVIADAVAAGDEAEAQRAMISHISVGGAGFSEFISMLPPSMLEP